jgi:hypothetical protein
VLFRPFASPDSLLQGPLYPNTRLAATPQVSTTALETLRLAIDVLFFLKSKSRRRNYAWESVWRVIRMPKPSALWKEVGVVDGALHGFACLSTGTIGWREPLLLDRIIRRLYRVQVAGLNLPRPKDRINSLTAGASTGPPLQLRISCQSCMSNIC